MRFFVFALALFFGLFATVMSAPVPNKAGGATAELFQAPGQDEDASPLALGEGVRFKPLAAKRLDDGSVALPKAPANPRSKHLNRLERRRYRQLLVKLGKWLDKIAPKHPPPKKTWREMGVCKYSRTTCRQMGGIWGQ